MSTHLQVLMVVVVLVSLCKLKAGFMSRVLAAV